MEHQPLDKYKMELKEVPLEPFDEFKRINCPSCHNMILAENININDKIAKCTHCNVIFPFQKEVDNFFSGQKIKQEVIRPEGIDIFRYRNELDISVQQPENALDIILLCLLPLFPLFGTIAFFH